MVGNDMKAFLKDTRGVSVIFGTLLLILITIIAASSVAYMISTTQKQAMELESHQTSVENEDLKIVSMDPVGNGSTWQSIDLKILNLNIEDSYISSISVNNGYFLHFKAYDSPGTFDVYRNYPAVYSANHRLKIPATKSKTVHLNFSDITVEGTEIIDNSTWTNNSINFTYSLQKHPWPAYGDIHYDYHVNDSVNSTTCTEAGNYLIDNESRQITFFGSDFGGSLTNTSAYDISYTIDFLSYVGNAPSENDPLKIEMITSYINVFRELFTPPMPVAEVQFKVESILDGNGTPTIKNYWILDASDSVDSDGFITGYRWAIWEDSNQIYNYTSLSGMVVRPVITNYPNTANNLTIDLMVIDDDGMTSKLSHVSGNLTIS